MLFYLLQSPRKLYKDSDNLAPTNLILVLPVQMKELISQHLLIQHNDVNKANHFFFWVRMEAKDKLKCTTYDHSLLSSEIWQEYPEILDNQKTHVFFSRKSTDGTYAPKRCLIKIHRHYWRTPLCSIHE